MFSYVFFETLCTWVKCNFSFYYHRQTQKRNFDLTFFGDVETEQNCKLVKIIEQNVKSVLKIATFKGINFTFVKKRNVEIFLRETKEI